MVLAGGGEHDDGDLGVAEHGELPRLLHDPRPALGVGHLPVGGVLDPLYLDLPPPHLRRPIHLLRPRNRARHRERASWLARSTDSASVGEEMARRKGDRLAAAAASRAAGLV